MTFAPQSLRRLPIFAALADTERRVIAPAASLRHLARGECAFSEGAPVGEFFLILSGHVKLSRAGRHRDAVILRIAHPGEPFGWAGGTQGCRQTTTAIALRDCTLAVWPIETWNGFLHDMPGLAIGLLGILERRLAVAQDRLVEMACLDVPRRIAHLVLRLIDQAGRQHDDGIRVDFPITRKDIAALTGTTLHSASRTLTHWERQGIIGGGRRELLVRDIPAVVSLATARPASPETC